MLLLLFPLLFFPFLDSCLLVSPTSKCQCPPIGYIGQARIANSEYGSYLANRTTTRPKVRVSDECLIMADVSALHSPNHFLMLFRTAAPPIFAKRLSESSEKIINLTDIYCVENNDGQFNWMYYGGVVNDLSVAVQSNEGMCECTSKLYPEGATFSNFSTCDTFDVECPSNGTDEMKVPYIYAFWLLTMTGSYLHYPLNFSLVFEDLTCVSGSWYFNSFEVMPGILCTTPYSDVPPCGCSPPIPLEPYSSVYTHARDGAFADYARSVGELKNTGCSIEMTCPANATLVIFSTPFNPFIYVPGTKPTITCASSSLATSPLSPTQLYVDGFMVSQPYFGCYEKKCPCSFAFLQSNYAQNYVGDHPSLPNITSVYNYAPYTDGPLVDGCPSDLQCSSIMTLYNLDTNDTARVISTEPYSMYYDRANISCSASTGKWMINGEEHNRLYAICSSY